MRLLIFAWLIALATTLSLGPAFGKCKLNMGKNWRNVGAAGTVKAVCKNSSCGGAQVNVHLTNFKGSNAAGGGALSAIKQNGKRTSSPIANWVGYHSEFTDKGKYRVQEIYYDGKSIMSDKVFLLSIASTSKTARANSRHAKSTLICR